MERMPFAEIVLPEPNPEASRRPRAFVSLGRVYFHCPACRRPTVLSRSHRGKRVSCPKCYTGIRVPDPLNKMPAQNLGRTLEPLLRPATFAHCMDARFLIPWLVGRLPGSAELVAAAGLILLLAVTTALAPVTFTWATRDRIAAIRETMPEPLAILTGAGKNWAREAREVVEQFLAAPTPAAKASLVADADRTAPLMADWYARRPGGGPQPEAAVTHCSQGFYANPGVSVAVSEVTVETPDSPNITYLVEHRPEGPRIAWPESVGYSPVDWPALLRQPPGSSAVPLRVLACRDDYYNYSFAGEQDFCCLRLHDPRTLELLGFGYVPRTPFIANILAATLPDASEVALRPVIVAVRPRPDSPTTGQVEIIGPVTPGWKTPAAGMALAQR